MNFKHTIFLHNEVILLAISLISGLLRTPEDINSAL